MKFKFTYAFAAILPAIVFMSCNRKENKDLDYLIQKENFKSAFTKRDKAPQTYDSLETNQFVIKVEYPSSGLMLKGLLSRKNIDSGNRKPVMVYLHGGFALGEQDVADCEYFTKKGYIVFAPSYRGENGNDGFFELFLGEIDDAKAAIKWISKQPFTDSTKIYVFGHSIGGGVSSMLSLEKDVPIAFCGSSGGIYDKEFYGWDEIIPFNKSIPMEGKMRVLIENVQSMQLNHYAFIGKEEMPVEKERKKLEDKAVNSKLKILFIQGDHFSSLEGAMKNFVDIINASK